LLVAAGSPGPSVAAMLARPRALLTLAVYSLATLAQALHGAFLVVKYLGAAYLLYLPRPPPHRQKARRPAACVCILVGASA
jgi:threonine/homoserine/homoserine lactone efflux protein